MTFQLLPFLIGFSIPVGVYSGYHYLVRPLVEALSPRQGTPWKDG